MSKLGALTAVSENKEDRYGQILEYLRLDNGYWDKNDTWDVRDAVFRDLNICTFSKGAWEIDFSVFAGKQIRNEAKFYVVYSLKNRCFSGETLQKLYRKPLKYLGQYFRGRRSIRSFAEVKLNRKQAELYFHNADVPKSSQANYFGLWNGLVSFITSYYDEREETEKDVWQTANIPGVKLSAAEKSTQDASLSFIDVPRYYRETVKRFHRRLITKRSWSYCREMLSYIKRFYQMFYEHGYEDGFFEQLSREDIEKYLLWSADHHDGHNATYRSKSISFVRYFIDYIQLAEYPQAPGKDVNRLIYEDDYPRRERLSDTLEKVRYIPAPVIGQLDAAVNEIEPKCFTPVYVLLRESGWRGTDILNLRYNNCLDYQWSAKENKYIPFLCGEITKTGIPQLKIPIRDEVAGIVKRLVSAASTMSTEENNPDRYLFNVYEGKKKGMPVSKTKFVEAIRELIIKKDIRDANGELYHFKTHAMRHTRALEYAEQGMPIGIIQQLLGHCSLQMTLHYTKMSENAMYEKWKETEKLGLFHVSDVLPNQYDNESERVNYEKVRENLDAVRVPFGDCFKPAKVFCKQQAKHCLECSNFCSTQENIPEYEAEIQRVTELIKVSVSLGRINWVEKNREYLNELQSMLKRIQAEGTVHKNGSLREVR